MGKENWDVIAKLLKKKDLMVKDAAATIGMSEQGLRKAVKNGSVSAWTMVALAELLELPLEDLSKIIDGSEAQIMAEPSARYNTSDRIISATDPHDFVKRLFAQRHLLDEIMERERLSRKGSTDTDVAGFAP